MYEFDTRGRQAGYLSCLIAVLYFATVYGIERLGSSTIWKPRYRGFLADYAYVVSQPLCRIDERRTLPHPCNRLPRYFGLAFRTYPGGLMMLRSAICQSLKHFILHNLGAGLSISGHWKLNGSSSLSLLASWSCCCSTTIITSAASLPKRVTSH